MLILFDRVFKALRYENCNPLVHVPIIRDKEEELQREKGLRKDVEQRYKVNCKLEYFSLKNLRQINL